MKTKQSTGKEIFGLAEDESEDKDTKVKIYFLPSNTRKTLALFVLGKNQKFDL